MHTIREAQLDDYYAHVELYQQLSSLDQSIVTVENYKDFLQSLNDNHKIFVLYDVEADQVVGTGTLLIEIKLIHDMGRVGHIEDIVIDKKSRGNGLGKLLVQFITRFAKARGCYKVILNCSDENIEFYEKNGFTRHGNEMSIYF